MVKVKIIIASLAVLFAMLSPLAVTSQNSQNDINNEKGEAESSAGGDAVWEPVMQVSVLMDNEPVTMDIEAYLVGVVAGEMPANFEDEALKAQAVAARTYTLYKIWVQPSANHDEAVCTEPACCKAYADEDALRERWGGDYEENIAKIKAAVWSTQGVYMVYDDEPVLAVFHSSSAGKTENSGDVWNEDVPYLVSVESPEDDDTVKTEISFEEFKSVFAEKYPDAAFSDDKSQWITDIVYTDSGRIDTLCIGGVTVRGTEFRSIYGLRSTAVNFETAENGFIVTSSGYGHGVGLSQYGANAMAKDGSNWQEILQWYYTGIEFDTLLGTI